MVICFSAGSRALVCTAQTSVAAGLDLDSMNLLSCLFGMLVYLYLREIRG